MPQMHQDTCLLGYKRSNSEYKSMSRGAKTHYAKIVFKIATLQSQGIPLVHGPNSFITQEMVLKATLQKSKLE